MTCTGGVAIVTLLAESLSRDFGSTIFKKGDASGHLPWRPDLKCNKNQILRFTTDLKDYLFAGGDNIMCCWS